MPPTLKRFLAVLLAVVAPFGAALGAVLVAGACLRPVYTDVGVPEYTGGAAGFMLGVCIYIIAIALAFGPGFRLLGAGLIARVTGALSATVIGLLVLCAFSIMLW